MTRAGTPATVVCGGTAFSTTDPAPELCGRMNIDREQIGHPVLNEERHQFAPLIPEKMRHAIAFQCMEPFEEKESLDIGMAGGIALEYGRKIGSHRLAHRGFGGKSVLE